MSDPSTVQMDRNHILRITLISVKLNAEIIIHRFMGGAEGQASDLEISARQILKIKASLNKILAKNTDWMLFKIKQDSDRDFYMNAEKAKKYAIVDKIVR